MIKIIYCFQLSEAIKKHLRSSVHRASELVNSGSLESLSLTLGDVYNSTTTTTEASTTMMIVPSTTMSIQAENLAIIQVNINTMTFVDLVLS